MNRIIKTLVMINPDFIDRLEEAQQRNLELLFLRKGSTPGSVAYNEIYYGSVQEMDSVIGECPITQDEADFIAKISGDVNNLILSERENIGVLSGGFLSIADNISYVRYCYHILKNHGVEVVVHHNYPHEVFNYILQKLALYLAIPCFQVCHSVLPWRINIFQCEKDGALTKLQLGQSASTKELHSVKEYFARLQGVHDDAIPATDRDAISISTPDLSFEEEMSGLRIGTAAKTLARVLKKFLTYRAYKKYVSHKPVSGTYVAFFMHYQPEETTMPRGGVFAQQLVALTKLRACFPNDVKIVVKENKATFRWPFTLSMNVRNNDFYQRLVSIPNTMLVPLETDTFDLIDNALAVSTITGTVGLEALCRGKAVFIFGSVGYEDFDGVVRFPDNKTGLPASDEIDTDSLVHNNQSTLLDLENELCYSCGLESAEHHEVHDVLIESTYRAFENLDRNIASWISDQGSQKPSVTSTSG